MRHSTFQLLCLFILALTANQSHAKETVENDFSFWAWMQLEKKISTNQNIGFQYQVRFNENASTFDRSNFYFSYDVKLLKNLNTEILYQLNTNKVNDQHTFYLGNTYKLKLNSRCYAFARTAVQHTRNYFSGKYFLDKPLTEWRNRIRLLYRFNKLLSTAVSAEPYVAFETKHAPYLNRVRYVGQFNFSYNKYQDFSIFYLYQPDIISYSSMSRNYVVGFANSIHFPNKIKRLKKMYEPTFLNYKKEHELEKEMKDTFS